MIALKDWIKELKTTNKRKINLSYSRQLRKDNGQFNGYGYCSVGLIYSLYKKKFQFGLDSLLDLIEIENGNFDKERLFIIDANELNYNLRDLLIAKGKIRKIDNENCYIWQAILDNGQIDTTFTNSKLDIFCLNDFIKLNFYEIGLVIEDIYKDVL